MKRVLEIGLIAALCLFGIFNAVYAEEFSAKVIIVLDGDTVIVLRDNMPIKVRLAEIDAPEKTQAFGEESTQSLTELVLNKQVRVDSRAIDDYGRLVALIKVDELNVSHEQAQRGMAWVYSRFNKNEVLLELQNGAKKAKRGLWAQTDPIPPNTWRKDNTTSQPQHVVQNTICGNKKKCSQMNSCDEANFYLSNCKTKSLDRDNDGVPCESLCGATK
ncbi:TNase-like domain-containing protein [Candidatus Nitrotoga sp. HW29]|uniref:thermonuclease family protein n=1 Tax=Candidatus Nitrotoga sp. HW29 TaxID=2886963 RepID=UPI001EF32713|nr:thermonuclease family protein [Candidatus Nitrotoga sp. HW29]CAH1906465.1 TNase-like domain-containing protein [Candidatus Nitrotoga sp. HW29]